jgi:hypothetical protein
MLRNARTSGSVKPRRGDERAEERRHRAVRDDQF